MDDLLNDFIVECNEFITAVDQDMVALEKQPDDKDVLNRIFRAVHSIKGACGVFGLSRLETVAHAAEDVLSRMREGSLAIAPVTVGSVLRAIDVIKEILAGLEATKKEPEGNDSAILSQLRELAALAQMGKAPAVAAVAATPAGPAQAPAQPGKTGPALADQSLRVTVEILDRLMNQVGELVLTRNQLIQLAVGDEGSRYQGSIQSLNRITSELQDAVMKTRMQPIGNAWAKLPRIVRDASAATGKTVELVMTGAETEIDRQILQELQDPLTHCVRNAIDHGIEKPEIRMQFGKQEQGRIQLGARQEGGQIIVEVRDDGAGVNYEAVRKKAVERGLVSAEAAAGLSEPQLIDMLFQPGFSTAAQVTELSGRGVGMDVVRSNVEKLGGSVELTSERGEGSTLRIRIPLTLAIVPALVVGVHSQPFAIPQVAVTELVLISESNAHLVERVHQARVLRLRGKLLPLVDLARTLGIRQGQPEPHGFFVVVTQVGDSQVGLVVQGVYDTQEIVVKPAGKLVRELGIYAGTTILGDGRVIMILDAAGIAARAGAIGQQAVAEPSARDQSAAKKSGNEAITVLLFRAGAGEPPRAIPLSQVARLEEFAPGQIEEADGRSLVQYREQVLGLVRLGCVDTAAERARHVIVASRGGRSVGLWVDEILDIVEADYKPEAGRNKAGVMGVAVVEGRLTELVDSEHYLGNESVDQRQQPALRVA